MFLNSPAKSPQPALGESTPDRAWLAGIQTAVNTFHLHDLPKSNSLIEGLLYETSQLAGFEYFARTALDSLLSRVFLGCCLFSNQGWRIRRNNSFELMCACLNLTKLTKVNPNIAQFECYITFKINLKY